MDRDDLIRRLMKTFLGEFGEHVQALDRDLLALERDPDAATRAQLLKSLLRTAHSLKGAARSVNIGVIEAAAHRLEAVFAGIRDDAVTLGSELFEILFAVVDAAKDASARLAGGEDLAEAPLAGLLPRLELAAANQLPKARHPKAESRGTTDDAERTGGESLAAMPADPAREGSIRLPAARLDRLLAMGGELLVARRRAEGRGADMARLLETAQRLEVDWRAADTAVRKARRPNGHGDGVSAKGLESVVLSARLVERTTEHLHRLTRQIDALSSALAADRKALDFVASPLEFEVLLARMVPFATACEGLERTVRDLAQRAGKDVTLTTQGGEIEIDRSIVQAIKDPLMHLVRNAVDHGIEPPGTRVMAGKDARGRITIGAALRHGRIEITVADDGRGLDVAAIREQARRQNLPLPEEDRDLARLVFASGFSTSARVTEISGRGVGLDVVRAAVQSRRGDAQITFEPGAGTRVVLTLPTSLSRISALLVAAGGQTYAFDTSAVRGLVRVGIDEIRSVEGRDVLTVDGSPLPLVSLATTLGQSEPAPGAGEKMPVVIVGAGSDHVGFVVKELIAEQDIVVKGLGPRLRRVRHVTGGTVLATGRIALILNPAELVSAALGQAATPLAVPAKAPGPALKRILVVDDSVTTRTLMKSILEAAGYQVMAAADGREAWDILQERGADLVVSDIEMPAMDGIALTEAIRGSKRLRNLPVILVTALASEQDRLRGLEAGADAYLVKSAFDQTSLIHTIDQIL